MTARTAVRPLLFLILATLTITSKAQLSADFSGTPLSGCAPLLVSFTDQSTGNPVQWRWDLGNGTISFLKNPSATYFNPGQYTVKLVIQNAAGTADSITKTNYITVYAQPTVNFTGTPVTGCVPLPVTFTDQSTAGSGTITSWQWDFGDGTSSSAQHPSHTYTAPGNYNVTLRVTNSMGCIRVLSKPQYIHLNDTVQANFSASPPNACTAPVTINFQNLSLGIGPLTYQWDFGDGGTSTLQHPAHTYLANGTYTVRLIVTNSSGCSDTITRLSLVSIGTQNASFSNPSSACVNSNINFTNTSVPLPTSFNWDFGDGTISTVMHPVKAYAAPGNYTIRMIAGFGPCADTAFGSILIVAKPTAAFTAANTTACKPPLTVSFTNQSTGGLLSYSWDFGDGTTSTLPDPTHTYTSYGSFDVLLIVTSTTGCIDSIRMPGLVRIQDPTATINGLPYSNCAPLTWNFSATVNSADPVTGYEWDLGDGTTSTLPNPSHTYAVGSYDIRLIITTAGGCKDTVTVFAGIRASTKPVVNFSATPRDACAQTPIHFTDLTPAPADRWLWDFGDGSTSIEQNPVHIYEDTGYFTVRLIVWNGGCPDTLTFIDYIHIDPPIANFSDQSTCNNPLFHVFTDLSIGADTWNWNFGDGGTSTLQNPTHSFADTGTYMVSLTVRNLTTGCEYTKILPIKVIGETANFSTDDREVCRNADVTFTAIGNNPANIASYTWDFGDGTTASGDTVVHAYPLSGYYSVKLVIVDITGCTDSIIKPQWIRVNGPTANFGMLMPGACLTGPAIFTDSSLTDGLHPINRWIWNFGDGTIDTLTAPPFQHAYTLPGNYDVSLHITDTEGCSDSISKTSLVIVSDPRAGFTTNDTLSCPATPISFTNTSTGTALLYAWNFGDGGTSNLPNPVHNYLADGVYTAQLLITDQYGCTSSADTSITIGTPDANFTMTDSVGTCPPLFVNFTNMSSNYFTVNWDFGDGTSTQSDNPSHFYTLPGTYPVKLSITGPGGCTDSLVKNIVVSGPAGNFSYGPLTGCKDLTVNFTAVAQNTSSYLWDFNDGSTVSTTNPITAHTYTIPGIYIPRMILLDPGGCVVPIMGPDTIKVTGVVAKFGLTNQLFCDSGYVAFTDSSYGNDPILSYRWEFGDGLISSQQHPVHNYTTPGIYYPRLIITTISGCIDTAVAAVPVKVVMSPQAYFTNSGNGCVPLTVNFNGRLNVPDSSALNWDWDFGNGNGSALQDPPAQVYTQPGIYRVRLIVTNSSGCRDTVDHVIEAYLVPVVGAGQDNMICRGTGTNLLATGADNYTWSPGTGLSCTNCPNPIANPDSSTTYSVTGTTLRGCSNTDTVHIEVTQRFNMLNSLGDTLCKGRSVRLFASGANSYSWSPATGLNSTTSSTPLASPQVTTTYMVVGSDDKGCFKDTGYVTVKVYPIPVVDAGPDKTINVGQTVDLIPTVSADVTRITWMPTNSIVQTNLPAIKVKPSETTEYTIEVKNDGGCLTRDRVTVFVICNGSNVFVPNTFSPNGDGANDVFYPRGTGLFTIKTFRIFNRWGEIVFEKGSFRANDASAGWNGTYKGARLNPDVFVYTMELICDNNTILTLKGNVALIQ